MTNSFLKIKAHSTAVGIILFASVLLSACGMPLLPFTYDEVSVPAPISVGGTTRVLAADGSLLAVFYSENREPLPLERIPLGLRFAVLAIEDKRFYSHRGYDIKAAARALSRNVAADDIHQGGSTLTEQYVKNTYFPTSDRTIEQKLREAAIASKVERELSKDEILARYLNSVYLGSGAFGVDAGARIYFGKGVEELDLSQAAMLAGIIRSPESYNPRASSRTAFERRNLVLDEMVRSGYIERNLAEAAKRQPLGIVPPKGDPSYRYPYFVEYVRQRLLSDPRLGADEEARATQIYKGGLTVQTTLVPTLQDAAEAAAHSALPFDDDPEVGLVSIDVSNGHIVAMVGGRNYSVRQFNLATDARRQAGSTFKVFGLVAALRSRVPPQLRLNGTPRVFRLASGELWRVQNFAGGGGGMMSLRDATVYSVNAAYADLVLRLGSQSVVSTAYDMGIATTIETNPSIILGGLKTGVSVLEMASAFSPLATGGIHYQPTAIDYIEYPGGSRISLGSSPSLVLSSGVSWQASEILQDAVARGTGRAARLPNVPVGGKTGTAENFADAWFVGYTPRFSTAVWVGYPDGLVPMYSVHGVRVAGGTFPTWIWRDYMAVASSLFPGGDFPPVGEEMQSVWISPDTGRLAGEYCEDKVQAVLPESVVPLERDECPPPMPEQVVSDTAPPDSSSGLTPVISVATPPAPPQKSPTPSKTPSPRGVR
jgi:penicillin-binding protein 1A